MFMLAWAMRVPAEGRNPGKFSQVHLGRLGLPKPECKPWMSDCALLIASGRVGIPQPQSSTLYCTRENLCPENYSHPLQGAHGKVAN